MTYNKKTEQFVRNLRAFSKAYHCTVTTAVEEAIAYCYTSAQEIDQLEDETEKTKRHQQWILATEDAIQTLNFYGNLPETVQLDSEKIADYEKEIAALCRSQEIFDQEGFYEFWDAKIPTIDLDYLALIDDIKKPIGSEEEDYWSTDLRTAKTHRDYFEMIRFEVSRKDQETYGEFFNAHEPVFQALDYQDSVINSEAKKVYQEYQSLAWMRDGHGRIADYLLETLTRQGLLSEKDCQEFSNKIHRLQPSSLSLSSSSHSLDVESLFKLERRFKKASASYQKERAEILSSFESEGHIEIHEGRYLLPVTLIQEFPKLPIKKPPFFRVDRKKQHRCIQEIHVVTALQARLNQRLHSYSESAKEKAESLDILEMSEFRSLLDGLVELESAYQALHFEQKKKKGWFRKGTNQLASHYEKTLSQEIHTHYSKVAQIFSNANQVMRERTKLPFQRPSKSHYEDFLRLLESFNGRLEEHLSMLSEEHLDDFEAIEVNALVPESWKSILSELRSEREETPKPKKSPKKSLDFDLSPFSTKSTVSFDVVLLDELDEEDDRQEIAALESLIESNILSDRNYTLLTSNALANSSKLRVERKEIHARLLKAYELRLASLQESGEVNESDYTYINQVLGYYQSIQDNQLKFALEKLKALTDQKSFDEEAQTEFLYIYSRYHKPAFSDQTYFYDRKESQKRYWAKKEKALFEVLAEEPSKIIRRQVKTDYTKMCETRCSMYSVYLSNQEIDDEMDIFDLSPKRPVVPEKYIRLIESAVAAAILVESSEKAMRLFEKFRQDGRVMKDKVRRHIERQARSHVLAMR